MTYRVYDVGPFTVACCGSFVSDGSHRWPRIDLIARDRWFGGPSCSGGRALRYRRVSLPLPWVPWYFGYRHRWARPAWWALDRLYRRLFYLGASGRRDDNTITLDTTKGPEHARP
jgi:hypothetical protein